jgi:hypothetical protein
LNKGECLQKKQGEVNLHLLDFVAIARRGR